MLHVGKAEDPHGTSDKDGAEGAIPSNFVEELPIYGDDTTVDASPDAGAGRAPPADIPSGTGVVYVVLYDYDPASGPNDDDDELTLKEGERLEALGEVDEDGFLLAMHLDGPDEGKQGHVPSTFIELSGDAEDIATATALVKVLYDYDPNTGPNEEEDELTIREGQIVRVFGEPDESGFYDGEHTDETAAGLPRGFLPSNFVDVLDESAALATGISLDGDDV